MPHCSISYERFPERRVIRERFLVKEGAQFVRFYRYGLLHFEFSANAIEDRFPLLTDTGSTDWQVHSLLAP